MAFPVGSLRVDLGANTVSFQTGMAAAQERLAEFQRGSALAGTAAQAFGRQVAAAGAPMRAFRGFGQQFSFQVQDIATQLSMGTSAAVAFGQNLPQLLGSFGAMGAAVGAAVAVLLPLSAVLLRSTEQATSFADATGAADNAIQAMADSARVASNEGLADVLATYGQMTSAVELLLERQAQVARQQGADVGRQLAEGLRTTLAAGGSFLTTARGDIAATLGIESSVRSFDALGRAVRETNPQLVYLEALLQQIANGDSFTAQGDAAARLQTFLDASGIEADELFAQVNEAEGKLRELALRAGETAQATTTATDAAEAFAGVDMASPVTAARIEAEGLAAALRDAMAVAARANYQRIVETGQTGEEAARRSVADLHAEHVARPMTGTLASGAGGVRDFAPPSRGGVVAQIGPRWTCSGRLRACTRKPAPRWSNTTPNSPAGDSCTRQA